MKNRSQIVIALLLGLVLPSLCLRMFPRQDSPVKQDVPLMTLQVLNGQTVEEIDMNLYITGVLLAEMPAEFNIEALKAQAVASRTFALYGKTVHSKHKDADVCTQSACCQGYVSAEEYLHKGGTEAAVRKATDAVTATQTEVIYYKGALIEATFFSSSGGKTEEAVAVWGTDVPYLQSVISPEENTPNWQQTVKLSCLEFCSALGINSSKVSVGKATHTKGGGIDSIQINGVTFTGLQLREKLKLKSTAITLRILDDGVEITTAGFGHRVGLSQYGAEAMAVDGCDYKEILQHYYVGITIGTYQYVHLSMM